MTTTRLIAAFTLFAAATGHALAAGGDDGLAVSGAWMRYLTPSVPAGGYFTLRNGGGATRTLTGASSPACGMLMLHQTSEGGGMSMMKDVQSLPIPPGGTLRFAPGGYHLMCMQPSSTMHVGGAVPVTLQFAGGRTLTVPFPVYGTRGP